MGIHDSETDAKQFVHGFCQAIATRNLTKLQSLLADSSILYWGPYEFQGKESISTWAKELFELFPFMSFKEKLLEAHGSMARHEFMIAFLTKDGQKGWLPCIADYDFEEGKLRQLKVVLLHGFLSVSRDDVERVRPHGPK